MQSDPGEDLLNLVDKVVTNQKKLKINRNLPPWENSRFELIRDLQIDLRGYVGEIFVQNCLKKIGYQTQRDEKTSLEEKGYDMVIIYIFSQT